jgi:signal transduction histidine kinase
MVLSPHNKAVLNERAVVEPGSYASAILNILDDFTDERERRGDIQRAVVNIPEDFAEERMRFRDTQRAVLNIVDDFDIERKMAERANIELRDENIERTRAEAALRQANVATVAANRELEAFSYSVAHDLRAPLRSIDDFSQALLEDCAADLPGTGMTYLGHIRESAQSMAQLITGLLSLSRVGRVEVSHSPISLSVIARTVFARLQSDQPDRLVE